MDGDGISAVSIGEFFFLSVVLVARLIISFFSLSPPPPSGFRAYKSTGGAPDRKLCGEKVWFAFHRSLMYLTVGFTIVGFILIM